LLTFEKLRQLRRVDTRNRDVGAYAVNHERQQQKDKPTAQITEFSCFCELSCVSYHV